MTPLHQALRTATAAGHARLEQVMALDPASLTRPRYARALQVLHAVRAGWEPGIEALLPGSTGPHLGWLAQDLVQLGAPPLPPAPALVLAGAFEAWGARYVLEGSALGGRMLLRGAEALGFSADQGARYFAGHGERTGVVWRAFLAQLEAVEPAAAIAGATAAFERLAEFAEGAMAA